MARKKRTRYRKNRKRGAGTKPPSNNALRKARSKVGSRTNRRRNTKTGSAPRARVRVAQELKRCR